ncbi:hypothetical protein N7540_012136 [Penicillium herquei]|nr:hypothetical protein N7540_012136 [Penicillium herquei]
MESNPDYKSVGTASSYSTTDHNSGSASTKQQDDSHDDDPQEETEKGDISLQNRQRVAALARKLTNTSSFDRSQDILRVNPFKGTDIPALDPSSPEFNAKHWAQTVFQLMSEDPERFVPRKAGLSFRNLSVHGFGSPISYQKDFLNVMLQVTDLAAGLINRKDHQIQILRDHNGLLRSGEMLLVLGRPGRQLLDKPRACTWTQVLSSTTKFRGDVVYQAETDVHFPQLTVGQTLLYAALAKTPNNRLPGVSREEYATHVRDVIMAVFGLSHTRHTKVGNEFIRGVSGGERKRVSIAEVALSRSPIQCWDNSTRGLDSATALRFVQTLRLSVDITNTTAIVALYQASQQAYEEFDKVAVLYGGRQIYFGSIHLAKQYFTDMGYHCPDRQTTADFLTSLTNPIERLVQPDFEARVPRTPDEFAERWKASKLHQEMMQDITTFEEEYPVGGPAVDEFKASRNAEKTSWMTPKSPYTVSVPLQVHLCIRRGIRRIQGDKTFFIITVGGNFVMSLILGSVYYHLSDDSSSMSNRCILLFFALLFNALNSSLEILSLYAQRAIVEKHATYAFYHPLSEALASMICDLPTKLLSTVAFNIPLYYMANLRKESGHVATYLLFAFASTLTMSMIFRTIGQLTRTIAEALTPAALFVIGLVVYTGYILPTRNMQGWLRWINYINPLAYSYEALVVNEFHGREFACASFVPSGPSYLNITSSEQTCSVAGASSGSSVVGGDLYVQESYGYYYSHVWRYFKKPELLIIELNLGIIIAYILFFMGLYLLTAEYITADRGRGEILLFRRKHKSSMQQKPPQGDEESAPQTVSGSLIPDGKTSQGNVNERKAGIHEQTNILHWKDVCYDIPVKGGIRRITDHVDGWVKPGVLTALMGATGAGKTTLLDVLANRVNIGVVGGGIYTNGTPRNASFQRRIGYVQQQDLHLETATIREALKFSAFLRQPEAVSKEEKLRTVEEVIDLLEMRAYAEAVIGVPGEGLNVEQRKRLTIGVELVAKPDLLFFLDEPTSGLDSQTAWSISLLLRKLTNHGQAILCTIHQPSAMLFQQFDRLLLLTSGGRTVYFGGIGENSQTLVKYFERYGAEKCRKEESPAEWMLTVIGAAPGSTAIRDWAVTWRESPEYSEVHQELERLEQMPVPETSGDASFARQYASPFHVQLWYCTKRVFEQYWRTPSYLYSKLAMCFITALFIGLSFLQTKITEGGLEHQTFAIFMMLVVFPFLVYQSMPNFILQRDMYEVRERPSKTYSWKAFILAQITVELPWNSLAAVITFFPFYYLIGMNQNASWTDTVTQRGGLMFLLIWAFFMHCSTFTTMVVASVATAEIGAVLSLLLFAFCLIFCGVMASPSALPGFWIFMYRVSPLTYIVSGMLSTGLANTPVTCADIEVIPVQPPSGVTCGDYLAAYIQTAGGKVYNSNATSDCEYCSMTQSNLYLESLSAYYDDRWRNFGLIWVYVAFNVFATLFLYWYVRVRGSPGFSHMSIWFSRFFKRNSKKQNA